MKTLTLSLAVLLLSASLPAQVQTGGGAMQNQTVAALANANLAKANMAATTDPAVSNDSTQGYGVGSAWLNTSTGIQWSCISAAVGFAIWVPAVTQAPLLFFDNFAGTAGAALNGRKPLLGSAWISNGAGAAQATAGAGVLGSTGGNTYYVAAGGSNPYEVVSTWYANGQVPSFSTISVVKDWAGHPLDAMWHVNFANGGSLILASYWNNTWNGGVSGAQVNVAPVYQTSTTCPTLVANTVYTSRLILNPPWSDATLENAAGTILCASRAYDPILASLVGPSVYVQTADANSFYTSMKINGAPAYWSSTYGRFPSGIDGTPIGRNQPAPANFSTLFVGPPGNQISGYFNVLTPDGAQAVDIPRFETAVGAADLIIQPRFTGNTGALHIKNSSGGNGGTFYFLIDGGFVAHVNHNNVDIITHSTTTPAKFIGMLQGSDAAPTPTSCGTSPAAAGSSTGGTVTEGSTATGCTITLVNAPARCVVTSEAGLVFTYSLTGAVLTVVNVGALSSTKLDYTCTL